jgi:hypothetical protein
MRTRSCWGDLRRWCLKLIGGPDDPSGPRHKIAKRKSDLRVLAYVLALKRLDDSAQDAALIKLGSYAPRMLAAGSIRVTADWHPRNTVELIEMFRHPVVDPARGDRNRASLAHS